MKPRRVWAFIAANRRAVALLLTAGLVTGGMSPALAPVVAGLVADGAAEAGSE